MAKNHINFDETLANRKSDGTFGKGSKAGCVAGYENTRKKLRDVLSEAISKNDFEKFHLCLTKLWDIIDKGTKNQQLSAIKLVLEYSVGKPSTEIEANLGTSSEEIKQAVLEHLNRQLGVSV